MSRNGMITMAIRELDRPKVIQAVIDGNIKPGRAAERLGLTDRQIRRLVNRVRAEDPPGVVSKRRGKPANRRLSPDIAAMALSQIRSRYSDFGPTSNVLVQTLNAQAADSMIRIACDGDASGASVTVNNVFKGECPIDVSATPGLIKIQAAKPIDQTRE